MLASVLSYYSQSTRSRKRKKKKLLTENNDMPIDSLLLVLTALLTQNSSSCCSVLYLGSKTCLSLNWIWCHERCVIKMDSVSNTIFGLLCDSMSDSLSLSLSWFDTKRFQLSLSLSIASLRIPDEQNEGNRKSRSSNEWMSEIRDGKEWSQLRSNPVEWGGFVTEIGRG